MPRKPRPECTESYFHIFNRCINKEWFVDDMDEVWRVFSLHINYCVVAFDIEVVSFVLMGNHYHMLARFPLGNRAQCMFHLSKQISHDLRKPSHRINNGWGSRYGCSQIPLEERPLHSIYKYIYHNPVAGGRTECVEKYPYSTLSGKIGFQGLGIKTVRDPILDISNVKTTLEWLNARVDSDVWSAFKRSSEKAVFSQPVDRNARRRIDI